MHIDSDNNKTIGKNTQIFTREYRKVPFFAESSFFLSKKRHAHNVLQMILMLEFSSIEVSKARNISTLVNL